MKADFPGQQEIAFFVENKDRFPEWEPRFGDWALIKGNNAIVVISRCEEHERTAGAVLIVEQGMHNWTSLHSLVPIYQPRQLWAMIKEQGLKPGLVETTDMKGNPTGVYAFAADPIDGGIFWEAEGPTPAIALGKCLLEIEKEEK